MAFYLVYKISVTNTGTTYDLIAGCTVFIGTVPQDGAEVATLHWFKIPNFSSGASATITIPTYFSGTMPEGDYVARARLWSGSSGGTKVDDLVDGDGNVVGTVYQAGTGSLLTPILDQSDYTWYHSAIAQMEITSLEVYVA